MKINRTHLLNMFMFFLLLVVGIIFSVYMKNEFYWDFANYHYYNAFAFLNNRLNYDIVPASVNTFFNPLIDLPLYFYIQRFNDNANLIYALQGVWGGLMLFVFYKIYSLFFKTESLIDYVFLGLALILSVSGQATFYQIGASTNEIPIAFFVLWGLYVLLKMIKFPLLQKTWKFFVAGLIMGIGLGLKQTIITYCIASGLSLIICYKYLNRPLRSIFFFALGGLAGYLMINGYFMLKYWDLYQNPFFPFLNGIFHSPYFDDFNYADMRSIPSLKEFLIYPFLWNFSSYSIAETSYIDFRLTLVYIFLLASLVVLLKQKNFSQCQTFTYLFVFLFLSFFLWMGLFSILRYAVVMEVLSTLFFIKIIQYLVLKSQRLFMSSILVTFFIIILLIPIYNGGWGHIKRDHNQFLEIEKINLPENTLLKLYGFPTAFVVPEFSKQASVQALGYMQYNCTHQKGSDLAERGAFKIVRDQIEKEHKGPVVVVFLNQSIFLSTDLNIMHEKRQYCEQQKEKGLLTKDFECSFSICDMWNNTEDVLIKELGSKYFCRPLKNNFESRLNICVPKELKKQILGEEND